ncbi:MAG: NADH-quinone oxidoreductase subunit M [gamma proteobacterium symbiont of Taylorina sp.]|nr:NADH-quinone oxidoreductase subunit M [gamma proteobacterium symbiont of Taylorina sp.]
MTEIHWAVQSTYPILASLQIMPLVGLIILFWLRKSKHLMTAGILLSIIEMGLALDLYRHFDHSSSALQFAEQFTLLAPLSYHAAVDGMSVIFILLTGLLSTLVIVYGNIVPLERPRHLPFLVLIIEAIMMSLFTTLDLLWFTLFSLIDLILLGYMLRRWATSPDRDLIMARYFQFMLTSMVLLIIGISMLAWNYSHVTGNNWTFDLLLLKDVVVSSEIRSIIFFLLFYGLAIRIPLFPMHGWLPLAAEHGTVAIAPVFLLGLKVGIYAILRFVFPLLPEAVMQWHEFIVTIAVIGVFYAAVMAMMQVNLRRLLSFAVISHTSVLIIGLFSLNQIAFEGAILLSINFGLGISGLLFMTGFVFYRTRTMLLKKLGGLFDYIPIIGITFLISALSLVGMPGTPGFDAAHLIMEASIHRFGALITIAAALGNVVAAGFLLWAFQQAFLSPKVGGWNKKATQSASLSEKVMAAIIIIILLTTGFYSEPWMGLIENSMHGLGELYGPHILKSN